MSLSISITVQSARSHSHGLLCAKESDKSALTQSWHTSYMGLPKKIWFFCVFPEWLEIEMIVMSRTQYVGPRLQKMGEVCVLSIIAAEWWCLRTSICLMRETIFVRKNAQNSPKRGIRPSAGRRPKWKCLRMSTCLMRRAMFVQLHQDQCVTNKPKCFYTKPGIQSMGGGAQWAPKWRTTGAKYHKEIV